MRPESHGELLKLGIEVAERSVSRLIPKRRTPPSQTWRTFLTNHVQDLVSIEFFTVPTAQLRALFVLIVLAHHRRRVLHFNVTEHPTAGPGPLSRSWTPSRTRPHPRISSAIARSPWQNPFAERLIGSIRRECLDHVLVLSESHLRHILTGYFAYYHRTRTQLSLTKDAPDGRLVEPPELGRVMPIREVGGLHHRYVRRAA